MKYLPLVLLGLITACSSPTEELTYEAFDIRINQVGYDVANSKTAIIQSDTSWFPFDSFEILGTQGTVKYTGRISDLVEVQGWNSMYFRILDFTEFNDKGLFTIRIGSKESESFRIDDRLIKASTYSLIQQFFLGIRNTMPEDSTAGVFGRPGKTRNVYGGWTDASGDKGKHLSHLSFANYLNPQQTPICVYALASSANSFKRFEYARDKLSTEAAWGADFLMRMLDEEGFFYISVFDNFGWSLNEDKTLNRELCAWAEKDCHKTVDFKAGMREGGGMSIAALANCSINGIRGEYSNDDYLNAAIRAYDHLKENNLKYLDNGTENIIDNYCRLIAAFELLRATQDSVYLNDCKSSVEYLINCQSDEGYFFSTPKKLRPFYHAAEEGLPLVALSKYYHWTKDKNAYSCILKNIKWYIETNKEGDNPFLYSKSISSSYNNGQLEPASVKFFIPQNNESEYWWQGENARLASLATGFKHAIASIKPDSSISVPL